ncbi:MAG: FapA family protein [Armatimonadetes bacterium]|nr:FapA family protein [Armatimonadota bacterium]
MAENRWMVVQARTIDEAITKGAFLLHVGRDQVEYEILEEARLGRQGRILRPYKVRLTINEQLSPAKPEGQTGKEASEPAYEFDREALESMDVQSFLALVDQVKRGTRPSTAGPKEKASATNFDGRIYTEISSDRMEAYLMITPPNGGSPVILNEIKSALAEARITYGIRWDEIEDMVNNHKVYRRVQIATGLFPKAGEDARLEFPQQIREGIRSSGETAFNHLMVVKQEQVVTRKVPMVPAMPGMTVTGETLYARDGRDFSLYARKGRNLRVASDGSELVATANGLLVIDGEKISVESGLEIEGDIDPETGNIDFVGDILIKGSIRRGVSIKSKGNIVVQGNIDAAIVEAGCHITVEGGILGRGAGSVRADRTVTCKFAQQARIEAGEDIIIHDYCIHSDARASRRLMIGGSIIGGMGYATQALRTKNAGNENGTPTLLVAGTNFQVREALEKLRVSIQRCREEREELETQCANLMESENQGTKLPVEKRCLLLESIQRIQRLGEQAMTLESERNRLLQNLDRERAAKISITSRAFPKVRVLIDEAALEIKQITQFATFSKDWDNGEIRMTSYY